jgi:hypothetical protein
MDEYIHFIINFESMLDTIHPEEVDIRGFYDKVDLIQQICKKKNIRLIIPLASQIRILLESVKNSIGRGIIIKRRELITVRKEAERIRLAEAAKHVAVSDIRKGCVIYLAHETYRRRIYDFETKSIHEGEYISQKILERIMKMGVDLLCIDVDHTFGGEFQSLRHRLSDNSQYWLPLEMVRIAANNKKLNESSIDIRQALKTLFSRKEFQETLNFSGLSLWKTLRLHLEFLLSESSLPQRIRDIDATKDLLLRLEPRSIFLLYERGPSAMTFIIAADELGIKTVGMQHGMIHKWHLDYTVSDIRTDNSILGAPVPTVTLIFGEFYKRLMTETFAYSADRVMVIGNPTYEGLHMYTQLDRKAILARLGLDAEKRMLLIATSKSQKKYGRAEYDVIMVETLAKSFAHNKDIQVVIKLHPKEDGMVYRQIIRENNAENFVIIDHPIEELILICDVFLAVATTTMLEAVVLQKPVIIFQTSENERRDLFSLLQLGAAIRATNIDLEKTVLELLNNRDLVESLRLKGLEFAKQHFNLPNNEINQMIADLLIDPNRTT